MVFALKLSEAKENLTDAVSDRSEMLRDLKAELGRANLQVTIDEKNGVLRLGEDAIRFETARVEPRAPTLKLQHDRVLTLLSKAFSEVLPCYSIEPPGRCTRAGKSSKSDLRLDVLLIEGHTDSQPCGPDCNRRGNRGLSTERAVYIMGRLIDEHPDLANIVNRNREAVLAAAGYGEKRPLVTDSPGAPNPKNRRIDIRVIMEVPSGDEGLERGAPVSVKQKLIRSLED